MCPALLLGLLAVGACDRALLDPVSSGGEEAEWLQAAGLLGAEGRFTLGWMTLEAARRLGSTDRARARQLLAGLVRQHRQQVAGALAGNDDPAVLAETRHALRQAQLTLVVEVLGERGVRRVLSGVAAGLEQVTSALAEATLRYPDQVPGLRRRQSEAVAELQAGRTAMEEGDLMGSLEAGTGAAATLLELQRALLDLDRIKALPELYRQAEQVLKTNSPGLAAASELLAEHERLAGLARVAVAGGDREQAQAALSAVRESELRITLETLGPACAAVVVSDVGAALAKLEPDSGKAEPRLRRMLQAAADLHYRAAMALERGDGIAALDLASFAAGLVNSYRQAVALD